ncbi:type VI secretion system-associated protein TagF [Caballeronia sp. Lep1P3]|uniref:type VI secretion system-associated protein TagF n=1 Tax=Caballeronia sp. Lep1P3 TaxID=2878150 RepID=UPI001FD46486|nr:type VI secretion system-associated protein TagF [Caballeronia sp. Lep1P3]
MRAPGAAGCFGKLRSNGDFVTRRLPASFVVPWDAMLQAGLVASRDALGSAWLDAYLTAPVWCFALAGDVIGSGAWAGVLMPSVDAAGRYFPLTIVAPVGGGVCVGSCGGSRVDFRVGPCVESGADFRAEFCVDSCAGWFARCRELALSTLMPGARLADFDAALIALADAPDTPAATADAPPSMTCAACVRGMSAWWTEESVRVTAGLPDAAFVAALFDGRVV